MKVSLPSFYEIEHQRDDGETKTRPQFGLVEIEIPEPKRSDVEVAADWIVYGEHGENRIECLVRDGDLYIPTLSRHGRFVTPYHVAELRHGYGWRHGYPEGSEIYAGVINDPNRPYYLHQWLTGNNQLFARPRGGTVVSSTEFEDAERFQFLADRTFILNDRVYQRVCGLHCEVFVGKNRYGDELTFSDLDYSKDEGETWKREWEPRGSFWFDEMRMSLNDVREHQMLDERWVAHQFYQLKIHKPEAFEFDGRSWFLDRFARTILRESKDHVGEWPPEHLANWLNLRAAVEGADGYSINDALPILETMAGWKLHRSAERNLERGFAGWKKLGKLLQDSDPNLKLSQAFVGTSMGRDVAF